MKDFVNKVISELKNDSNLNENSLVKLVIESTNKSIASNSSYDNIYSELKNSLVGINEHIKNKKLNIILSQFNKQERTPNSILNEMSKVADLSSKLSLIRESNAYSNPIIRSKVDNYANALNNGSPEFKLYPSFISEFTQHIHESSVKKAVDQVVNVLENRANDLEVLNTIHMMDNSNSVTRMYESISAALKKSLVENKYSADIINLMHGESNLPLVTQLVNNLRIMESSKDGTFTLGAGTSDTRIQNLIAPAKKLTNGILTYADGRFIKISESTKLSGNESEVHINEKFTIATMNPEFVKAKFPEFYSLSEAFATLGFKPSASREGVEGNSIRNFKLGLNTNKSNGLDIYLNDNKVDGLDSINLTEALVMETPDVKNRVQYVLENINNIVTFEFIKNITNDRLISEATVFELSGNYIVCDKPNSAERVWNKVDEHQMFDFFNEKFQYDISPIFKSKIDESITAKRRVEAAKSAILENVAKLEGSVKKLNETIKSKDVDPSQVAELEKIKSNIQESISKLKEDYINVDLSKADIKSPKSKIDEGEMPAGLKAYHDKKKAKKDGKTGESDDDKKKDKDADNLNKSLSKQSKKLDLPDITKEEKGKVNENFDTSALMAKYGKVHN